MARSVTPPPISDRTRILAGSARRQSKVLQPRAKSPDTRSSSNTPSRGRNIVRTSSNGGGKEAEGEETEVKPDPENEHKTNGSSMPHGGTLSMRNSVKREPQSSTPSNRPRIPAIVPNPSSPHLSRTAGVASPDPAGIPPSASSLTRTLKFQPPIVAYTGNEHAGTSDPPRRFSFRSPLVAEPPQKKSYSATWKVVMPAQEPEPSARFCDSDRPLDEDGHVLERGKRYFVGVAEHVRVFGGGNASVRRSPRKGKPAEIFSSLHMIHPPRKRRKVSSTTAATTTTNFTASQVSRQYNHRMDEQIGVMNNAWNANAGVGMDGTSISTTHHVDRKGKGRAMLDSPSRGPTGLTHVLNKAYQAYDAPSSRPRDTLWYFDTGTLKWVKRDHLAGTSTTSNVAGPSVQPLPSPAITPIPEPTSVKRPRGRPRKNSQAQAEPSPARPKPPSRYVPTGRPRGRPRKNPLPGTSVPSASPRTPTGRPRGRPPGTGRPRGRPRKNLTVDTSGAGTSAQGAIASAASDYRLHQPAPDVPPISFLHQPSSSHHSISSGSNSHYSVPSASSLTAMGPGHMQYIYALQAQEEHREEATPPAPSGTSVGGQDEEDVLSYLDPNAPLSPEIGFIMDTGEDIDQEVLDSLVNLD